VGLGTLGIGPRFAPSRLRAPGRLGGWHRLTRSGTIWGRGLLALRTPLAPLYLGVFSGLLPCPLVYAFLARAAAAPGYLGALATMAALGAGTVPVLAGVALSGSTLSPLVRSRLVALSGALLVAFGFWTFWRGWSSAPCCG
jgi:hypothetical protein